MRTLKELAHEALAVQNACNPLGVSKSYAKALDDLYAALGEAGEPRSTYDIRNHPINRLWASKLHDLAGIGMSDIDRHAEAHGECERIAGVFVELRP